MRSTRLALATAVVATATAVALAATATTAMAKPRPAPRPAGNFVSVCRYSHSAPDDPIVFPASPGAAWDPAAQARLVTKCLNAAIQCGEKGPAAA